MLLSQLSECVRILYKYNKNAKMFLMAGDHEFIYIDVDPNEVTDLDKHILDQRDVFVSEEFPGLFYIIAQ